MKYNIQTNKNAKYRIDFQIITYNIHRMVNLIVIVMISIQPPTLDIMMTTTTNRVYEQHDKTNLNLTDSLNFYSILAKKVQVDDI